MAHQTSRHIEKYGKNTPRFSIDDDEKHLDEETDQADSSEPVDLSSQYLYSTKTEDDGVLCIQVNGQVAAGGSEEDLRELSAHCANLVSKFIKEEGMAAQVLMESLEPPTFEQANRNGFTLKEHYRS